MDYRDGKPPAINIASKIIVGSEFPDIPSPAAYGQTNSISPMSRFSKVGNSNN